MEDIASMFRNELRSGERLLCSGRPPGSRRYLPPSFELIEDASTVYDLVRKAQKEFG